MEINALLTMHPACCPNIRESDQRAVS